ncbi:hypothetical protein [Nocardioides sp. YIM 152588]|uniref:hypothetical protein n=1 Tax=Nocardioides sp. YIM 152588 TaxID=3158259 RepID=UPI0032E4684B
MKIRATRSAHARGRLAELWEAVEEARSSERVLFQKRPARADTVRAAREVTLEALLAYAAAIEALSWPVPRGIHLEITLYRGLCEDAAAAGRAAGEPAAKVT